MPGGPAVGDLHALVGDGALAFGLAITAWAVLLLVLRRQPGVPFFIGVAATVFVVALSGLLGLVTLVIGPGPRDGLHILYGALAVAALPVAALYIVEFPLRRRLVAWPIAGAILLALIWRLFATGG
jgi:hypothetical protein